MAMLDMRPETMQPALAIEDVELAGSLSGYASVFGLSDLHNDVVERGAIARSPAKAACRTCGCSGKHDAAEPIGMWTAICEDARGLYVEGRLARVRDALELMRGGGWKACPSAFAPSRRARMPALARATSSKPIFGRSRSSPFRCGRRRVSSGKAGTADDP